MIKCIFDVVERALVYGLIYLIFYKQD